MAEVIVKARARLDEIIDRGAALLRTQRSGEWGVPHFPDQPAYEEWRLAGKSVLRTLGPSGHHREAFEAVDEEAVSLGGYPRKVELQLAILKAFREDFDGGYVSDPEKQKELGAAKPSHPSRRVFVVHGHDDAAKEATARFLSALDFEPIILHEQPNGGRTLIEKFEKYSDVAFAVVLLTPDDTASSKKKPTEAHDRARQNVVFELGFFIGKLGRANVCPLLKGDVEQPSDYDGVAYVRMDPANGWKTTLAREMRAAGLAVDGEKLMAAL
jgi:predicted nucleotide-binding protein